MKRFLFGLALFSLCASSCLTQRNVEYLQNDSNSVRSFKDASSDDYTLRPKDELYIQISSLDDPSVSVFTTPAIQQSMSASTIQPYGAAMNSYRIDIAGNLSIPVVGVIPAAGKTISEVSAMITESLTQMLNRPTVSVKLVNRYVSVLGEVKNPGCYAYSQERLTIFDALGLAGDMTDFGNRCEVLLTRNQDGVNRLVPLDLTATDILESEYYYICPNDILYVKPLTKKLWLIGQINYTVILSTITTGLFFYSVLK
ncbi:polysaccharide biosynthesis/export family protein [Sunxiuqinia dokdonensis]|uniref:polysaccharide biosynthesis/export family protein n=1 Tax=Sunxiuqinia dokdonensis TaxID=1409788 RepID=UPI0009E98F22|nr:polysaccharide biosynthesis/export family protein [Sunxiuqinia dokdonensis]